MKQRRCTRMAVNKRRDVKRLIWNVYTECACRYYLSSVSTCEYLLRAYSNCVVGTCTHLFALRQVEAKGNVETRKCANGNFEWETKFKSTISNLNEMNTFGPSGLYICELWWWTIGGRQSWLLFILSKRWGTTIRTR